MRILHHLGEVVNRSGRSRAELEEQLGLTGGALTELLSGRAELMYRDLIAILEAVGYDRGRFFGELFPKTAEGRDLAAN